MSRMMIVASATLVLVAVGGDVRPSHAQTVIETQKGAPPTSAAPRAPEYAPIPGAASTPPPDVAPAPGTPSLAPGAGQVGDARTPSSTVTVAPWRIFGLRPTVAALILVAVVGGLLYWGATRRAKRGPTPADRVHRATSG